MTKPKIRSLHEVASEKTGHRIYVTPLPTGDALAEGLISCFTETTEAGNLYRVLGTDRNHLDYNSTTIVKLQPDKLRDEEFHCNNLDAVFSTLIREGEKLSAVTISLTTIDGADAGKATLGFLICKGSRIPDGFVIIAHEHSSDCPGIGKNAIRILRPGREQVVCKGSPIPSNYVITGAVNSIRCSYLGENAWKIRRVKSDNYPPSLLEMARDNGAMDEEISFDDSCDCEANE